MVSINCDPAGFANLEDLNSWSLVMCELYKAIYSMIPVTSAGAHLTGGIWCAGSSLSVVRNYFTCGEYSVGTDIRFEFICILITTKSLFRVFETLVCVFEIILMMFNHYYSAVSVVLVGSRCSCAVIQSWRFVVKQTIKLIPWLILACEVEPTIFVSVSLYAGFDLLHVRGVICCVDVYYIAACSFKQCLFKEFSLGGPKRKTICPDLVNWWVWKEIL